MKDLFPGYYRPTPEEFDDLWKKATFVFDANVLLHIHRRNKQTRRAILDTLKKLGDQLWIPYEIAAEYQRNKLKVAHSLVDGCKTVLDGLNGLKEQLRTRDLREHPFLDTDALAKGLDQLVEQVTQARGKSRSISLDDAESIELANLLRGRLDEPYSGDPLGKKIEEAKTRAKAKIPPGYKDFDSKTDDVRAGSDTLIWFKLIERAKGKQCPIILVTDDQKEDWWWTHQGLTHGPRPELGQEMWSLAQQRFYMYTLSNFLGLAGEHLGQNVPAEVVEEVKEHEQEQKALADARADEMRMLGQRRTELQVSMSVFESEKQALLESIEEDEAYTPSDTSSSPSAEVKRYLVAQRAVRSRERLREIERTLEATRRHLDAVNIRLHQLPSLTSTQKG